MLLIYVQFSKGYLSVLVFKGPLYFDFQMRGSLLLDGIFSVMIIVDLHYSFVLALLLLLLYGISIVTLSF